MQRSRNTGGLPKPPANGSWLAGFMIGTVVATMAGQAMVLGAAVAIQDATLKRG